MARLLQYMFLSWVVCCMYSVSNHLYAQDRCGTVEYTKSLYPNDSLYRANFERWLSDRMLRRTPRGARQKAGPYQIPVVVHVVHNGEPVGVGANISDAQIESQIRVLNEDFQRLNTDTVNTPNEFASVAGGINLEFVLAKRDPEGLPTNGIIRVNGGRSVWTPADNYDLKQTSYWPAEEYMNIWVCNLGDDYVGYAQQPESTLQGLENSSKNRLTDGIVVWYKAFGSSADGSFNLDPIFDKGRTATHETGHFLGLIHIWGDDGNACSGTDYVADTPNQAGRTSGCPSHPRSDACGQVIMFQNFMDYTNDNCMNLFTEGQIARVITVLENSPRRTSLLTSPGLQDPVPLANDLGIRRIVSPDASVCSNQITPAIELRNYGNNTVTSARITFKLDGVTRETLDFSLSLDPLESVEKSFTSLPIASGTHTITFEVLLTNGGTDSGRYNDDQTSTVIIPTFGAAPFSENFTTPPIGWVTYNPDSQITWQITTAPQDAPSNKALKLNCFDYEDKLGEIDAYLSPVMDLSSAPTATLSFDVAYARFQSSNERLKVVVMTNCETIYEGTEVYNKGGDLLKTAPSTSAPFTPSGASQWRKELIDLSAFAGLPRVQIAFIGINDWGNNIYVDNISLYTDEAWDVALDQLVSPSIVACEDEVAPTILIRNKGTVTITSVNVQYKVNEGAVNTLALDNLDLSVAKDTEITLPLLDLHEGVNHLFIELTDPNGFADSDDSNNSNTYTLVVNKEEDRIPLRQNFDDGLSAAWTIVSPTGGMEWETVGTNFGTSLYFNAYDNPVEGDEAWFVSPVLDFSRVSEASMRFDLSYAAGETSNETLAILASTDCGLTYKPLNYTLPIAHSAAASWIPVKDVDWMRNILVNLSSLAGETDVRIAFVVRNGHGNNLYIDNIEFFTTANPSTVEIDDLYSVYGYDLGEPSLTNLQITFNLQERQDVRFSVINIAGQMETDGILKDVLNQTFPLNLSQRLPPGVYFIRVLIGKTFYTSKVIVSR